jgi:hypothetical protein
MLKRKIYKELVGYRLKKKCKIGVTTFSDIEKFAITTTMI